MQKKGVHTQVFLTLKTRRSDSFPSRQTIGAPEKMGQVRDDRKQEMRKHSLSDDYVNAQPCETTTTKNKEIPLIRT